MSTTASLGDGRDATHVIGPDQMLRANDGYMQSAEYKAWKPASESDCTLGKYEVPHKHSLTAFSDSGSRVGFYEPSGDHETCLLESGCPYRSQVRILWHTEEDVTRHAHQWEVGINQGRIVSLSTIKCASSPGTCGYTFNCRKPSSGHLVMVPELVAGTLEDTEKTQ